MKNRGTVVAIGLASSLVLMAAPAVAQDAPKPVGDAPTGDAPKPADAPDAKMEEARMRYQRGLQLFNEGNYEAARVEFERAYQLAPTFKLLYNIGLSYEQLGDYVQAQVTLTKYLEQGGSEISEERRKEVEKELAQIRPRIARVVVIANVPGAQVTIDDNCGNEAPAGIATCGPMAEKREVLVNPGRRRFTLRKDGYLPETQVVTVAGSDRIELKMNLKELPKGSVEKKSNPHVLPMGIAWGVTVAGATTAIITGVLANKAADDRQAAVDRFGATRDEIDDLQSKTRTLATVSDVFWIGTGVAALAGGYFTYRMLTWKGESGDVNVQVGTGRLSVGGHF